MISHSTGPSLRHWLGTDFIGRDIFSQLLAGARIAFMVGISSALISILFGTTIGMVAGYAGRYTDIVLMRLADMIMVMPTLLVVLILSALFGQLNIWVIVLDDRPVPVARGRPGDSIPDPFPAPPALHRGGTGGRCVAPSHHIQAHPAQRDAPGPALHDLSGSPRPSSSRRPWRSLGSAIRARSAGA